MFNWTLLTLFIELMFKTSNSVVNTTRPCAHATQAYIYTTNQLMGIYATQACAYATLVDLKVNLICCGHSSTQVHC